MVTVGWNWRSDALRDRETATKEASAAFYTAQRARYENSHDKWAACIQLAASRDITRASANASVDYVNAVLQVFTDFTGQSFDAELQERLDTLEENRRRQLDTERPALDPADCGSEPIPPPLPESNE
jgi:hypothetical protein